MLTFDPILSYFIFLNKMMNCGLESGSRPHTGHKPSQVKQYITRGPFSPCYGEINLFAIPGVDQAEING